MPSDVAWLGQIADLLDRGAVRPPPVESLPIEEVAHAHSMVQSGTHRAKLVLQVSDDSAWGEARSS
jgi:NADPH2:quinone reductase